MCIFKSGFRGLVEITQADTYNDDVSVEIGDIMRICLSKSQDDDIMMMCMSKSQADIMRMCLSKSQDDDIMMSHVASINCAISEPPT